MRRLGPTLAAQGVLVCTHPDPHLQAMFCARHYEAALDGDEHAYGVLVRSADVLLKRDRKLPPALREFIRDVLNERLPIRKPGQRKDPEKDHRRFRRARELMDEGRSQNKAAAKMIEDQDEFVEQESTIHKSIARASKRPLS